jgi:hypothetical protein
MKPSTYAELFCAIDAAKACRYILSIISPVASVAGREAGSYGSASAFPGVPREDLRLRGRLQFLRVLAQQATFYRHIRKGVLGACLFPPPQRTRVERFPNHPRGHERFYEPGEP